MFKTLVLASKQTNLQIEFFYLGTNGHSLTGNFEENGICFTTVNEKKIFLCNPVIFIEQDSVFTYILDTSYISKEV